MVWTIWEEAQKLYENTSRSGYLHGVPGPIPSRPRDSSIWKWISRDGHWKLYHIFPSKLKKKHENIFSLNIIPEYHTWISDADWLWSLASFSFFSISNFLCAEILRQHFWMTRAALAFFCNRRLVRKLRTTDWIILAALSLSFNEKKKKINLS